MGSKAHAFTMLPMHTYIMVILENIKYRCMDKHYPIEFEFTLHHARRQPRLAWPSTSTRTAIKKHKSADLINQQQQQTLYASSESFPSRLLTTTWRQTESSNQEARSQRGQNPADTIRPCRTPGRGTAQLETLHQGRDDLHVNI